MQISKIELQLAKVFSAVGVPLCLLCTVVDSPINPADEYDNRVVDSVSLFTTFLSIVFSHNALLVLSAVYKCLFPPSILHLPLRCYFADF